MGQRKRKFAVEGHQMSDGARESDRKTYDRATNADSYGQLHLALHCHPNRGDMLGGVSDEGQQDQSDERLGDTVALSGLLDGSND
jgi:hypothetical protein